MGPDLPVPTPQTSLLEFDSDGARFLFDLASAAGAERADRTVAAWGRSRPAPRPRDQAYQRGYPDTLWSMNSLAATRRELGDLQGARELLEQTLTRRQRVLGDDHPIP